MHKVLGFRKRGISYSVYSFGSETQMPHKSVGAKETIDHVLGQGGNVVVAVTSGNRGEALKREIHGYNLNKSLEEKLMLVNITSPNGRLRENLSALDDGRFPYSVVDEFGLSEVWLTKQGREERGETAGKNALLDAKLQDRFEIKKAVDVTNYRPIALVNSAKDLLVEANKDRPLDYLAVPTGSGVTATAFDIALKELHADGIDTKLVCLVPQGEHPMFNTYIPRIEKNRPAISFPKPFSARSLADKLSCPGTDLIDELRDMQARGHLFIEVGNEEIEKFNVAAYRLGKKNKHDGKNPLLMEDSATVGFALAKRKYARKIGLKRGANVGVFTTGRGLYSTPSWAVEDLLQKKWGYFKNDLKSIAAATGIFVLLWGSSHAAPYISGKLGLVDYATYIEQNSLYRQKRDMVFEIWNKDNKMPMAIADVTKGENPLFWQTDEGILDKVITRYLELKRPDIIKIGDPRDAAPYNNLGYLLARTEQLSKKQ